MNIFLIIGYNNSNKKKWCTAIENIQPRQWFSVISLHTFWETELFFHTKGYSLTFEKMRPWIVNIDRLGTVMMRLIKKPAITWYTPILYKYGPTYSFSDVITYTPHGYRFCSHKWQFICGEQLGDISLKNLAYMKDLWKKRDRYQLIFKTGDYFW